MIQRWNRLLRLAQPFPYAAELRSALEPGEVNMADICLRNDSLSATGAAIATVEARAD